MLVSGIQQSESVVCVCVCIFSFFIMVYYKILNIVPCSVCFLRPTFECLSFSCGGTGQQGPATGAGALGVADLGVAQAFLEEIAINSTIELPELTQEWGNRLLEGTKKKHCVHQDPGKRNSDPTRD